MIADLGHAHARFLVHLARHGVLETLARLDEPGNGRIAARGPARLAPEEHALAVRHQHDDRGIDARKLFAAAGRVAAHEHVSAARATGG